MSRRMRYFLKQKLAGLVTIAAAIVTVPALGGDATLAVLLAPMGIYLTVTRKMCIYTDYYFDMQERRHKEYDNAGSLRDAG